MMNPPCWSSLPPFCPQAAYYLFQLEEWGYTLSEVESLITAHAMKDTKGSKDGERTE